MSRTFFTPAARRAASAAGFPRRTSRSLRFQKTIVLVEGLARHAIRTAEIAAVHHRDAQVVDRGRNVSSSARRPLIAASGIALSRGSIRARATSGGSAPRRRLGKRVGARAAAPMKPSVPAKRREIAGAVRRAWDRPTCGSDRRCVRLHRHDSRRAPPSPPTGAVDRDPRRLGRVPVHRRAQPRQHVARTGTPASKPGIARQHASTARRSRLRNAFRAPHPACRAAGCHVVKARAQRPSFTPAQVRWVEPARRHAAGRIRRRGCAGESPRRSFELALRRHARDRRNARETVLTQRRR